MKILLTGGLGYIGSHTAVELLNNNHEIVVFDNLSNSDISVKEKIEKITNKTFKFYQADMLDSAAMDNIFATENVDAVIHFAGLKAVGESEEIPLEYYHTNIMGTINILNAMKKHNVFKFVFSSSACVYSPENPSPIKEDGVLAPGNPYGRTKLFIEEILKDLYKSDNRFEITILRYFNPIGAHESGLIGEDPNGIPNNLMPYITRVATGKLAHLTVYGNDYPTPDGTGVRDFIHVVDLAEGHIKALDNLKNGIKIYNLGTGTGYSVLEVINAFNSVCGNKVNYVIGQRRKGDAPVCFANPSKARQELGFIAKKNLINMCESSYNFEMQNKKE